MGRAILGVILGYLAMFVVVAVAFTTMHLGLGTERVFRPGSFEASPLFLVCAVVVSLAAAILGGLVCASIARAPKPPVVLAGIIFVLGVLSAGMSMSKPAAGPRTGDITPMEAAMRATQPQWYSWSLPVIGAAGCMIGARLRKPVTRA